MCIRDRLIAQEIERVAKVKIGANKKVQELLESYDSIPVSYTHLDVYKRQEWMNNEVVHFVPPICSFKDILWVK